MILKNRQPLYAGPHARRRTIVTVTYHNRIYNGEILYLARLFCVSLRAQPRKWTASVFENRVKEDAEAAREFHIVARVAKPCCS